MNDPIQIILVPQGAEHQAVCKGLRGVSEPPTVFPIPVGTAPLLRFLEKLQQAGCFCKGQRILVMGLCGGLVPSLRVGDIVLYQAYASSTGSLLSIAPVDLLTTRLQKQLNASQIRVSLVKAVTSDRVVSTPAEKYRLGQESGAQVVDMEGYAALEFLAQLGTSVATLRVVSDDCQHAIPNLAYAFDSNGNLKPIVLAAMMIRQPIAAVRLIRGSLRGLATLTTLTQAIFG